MTARAAAITGAAAAAVLVAVGLVVARGDDSAPVRGCREHIEGPRTITPERADTVIGPIALGALPATYRPRSGVEARGLGTGAPLRHAGLQGNGGSSRGGPRHAGGQRSWMKLIYERPRAGRHTRDHPAGVQEARVRGGAATGMRLASLQSLPIPLHQLQRRVRARLRQRPEAGPLRGADGGVEGSEQPLHERLFRPRAAECPESLG
jgi:hypothetical protein